MVLRLLTYSIYTNWSVMFTGGHPTVTFLWCGCGVWASKYVMCARFQTLWLSDQKWFWLVWFICVVCWSCLNIPVYIVVYAQILEQRLYIMRGTKNIWVTDAAQKPCKAWAGMIGVTYDVRSHLLDINCSSCWLEHYTSDMHLRGYRFESYTGHHLIWLVFLWFSSISPDGYPKICHDIFFIPCSYQSPSRTQYTVQCYHVYSNIKQGFFLKYYASIWEVIRNSCMKCHTRPKQLDHAERNQDLHCPIVM